MEKIAIIGFGGHVQKNIIPALKRSDQVEIDCIYVRNPDKYSEQSKVYGVTIRGINGEIGNDVDWVYISTPIATHFELVFKYLKKNKNVICEKLLTSSLNDTKALFDLAQKNAVQLFEVCMYKYHKQYAHLVNTVNSNAQNLKKVNASFSIPHLEKDDIRYKKELGGGALLDVGYYPVSLLISLFGEPLSIKSTSFSEKGYDVDLSGAAIFEYESFYGIAEWGIGLPYSNQIILNTDKKIFKYDRIFSKPETLKTIVNIQEGFETTQENIGSDDQFLNLFNDLLTGNLFTENNNSIVLKIAKAIDQLV